MFPLEVKQFLMVGPPSDVKVRWLFVFKIYQVEISQKKTENSY